MADVLATTANSSAQTVKDLGEALAYVGPVATDAGLSIEDAARCLGISKATADRHWTYARAWLFDRLDGGS